MSWFERFLYAFALVVVMGLARPAHAANEQIDTSFTDPNLNNLVSALAVSSDGKILVGGVFTTAGTAASTYQRLARFNTDGTLDPTFGNPAINNTVTAVAIQSDGKIIVGGTFTSVNGTTRGRAARLNSDGSLDTSFADPDFNGQINSIAIRSDGKILFAGNFSTADGNSYGRVALVDSDGMVNTGFTNPTATGSVSKLLLTSSGKILIGGTFTSVGGTPQTYGRVAQLNADGSVDTSFNDPGFDSTVNALALQSDGKIMVGGQFTVSGATPRSRLARLYANGTLDTTFSDPLLDSTVFGIAVQNDGKAVIGGAFTTVGASSTAYQRLARLTSTGAIDTTFGNQSIANNVGSIALLPNGKILVGGLFSLVGSPALTYGRLARFFGEIYTLTLTTPSNGSVSSGAGGINCGATCTARFGSGTPVALTATPAEGYSFAEWGGGCSGTANPLTVTISADTSCTATFRAGGPVPPPPAFVSTPVTAIQNAQTVGSGTGTLSLASSFTNPQNLTFTATQNSGAPLPSWLTFNPATVSFAYSVPIPSDLPVQPLAADSRADSRASWANTVYPLLIRVAQVPVTLTATGDGQSYAATVQMNFYAPRSPVAISAVSLSLDGARGNGRSGRSALSWDGGQMVFETGSTNIFPAAANRLSDIVRYQALSGARDRLSQTAIPGGGVANAADGASTSPAVSSDGRYAAFASDAPSVSPTPHGGVRQVYRTALGYPRVPLNGTETPAPDMVSTTAAGIVGDATSDHPVLSQDGRYVAFESMATNFDGASAGQRRVWRKDMQTGALEAVSAGTGLNPSISWDGRYVAFDDGVQVYLRDMTANAVRTIAQGRRPRTTARADRITFVAGGQVMLAEVATGASRAVTAGNGISDDPSISADGRFIAFRSAATNLVAGFAGNDLAQIFVQDVERGVTALVTQTASGGPGNGASWSPALSGDGGSIAFSSDARDLVNGSPVSGQTYLAANPLPLPAKTGYWYMAAIGGGQGWAVERWGNRAYVGGLAYDAQGRSLWLAGFCPLSGLSCSGRLDAAGAAGPTFVLTTAETGNSATLSVGSAPPQALTPFPIGGGRTTGYAGLPQAGWWYEAGRGNNVGYFLDIDTQPQPDGSVAQIGYLSVLGYDAAGRPVWQSAQSALGADLSLSGTLIQYAGGAPFGAATAAAAASAAIVGPVRLTFDGPEAARIILPDGRAASLSRFRF